MSGLLTATHMGSIEEDLDWSGSLLGGLTIMPYVSHSVSRGQPFVVSSVSVCVCLCVCVCVCVRACVCVCE